MTETAIQTDPNACAHCGSKVSSYPMGGCPGCGAPNCCQKCCDEANRERLAEQVHVRAVPMHPPMKHLTALNYFLIAGFQPRGRTELFQQPKGHSVMEHAAQVVMAALKRAQGPVPGLPDIKAMA